MAKQEPVQVTVKKIKLARLQDREENIRLLSEMGTREEDDELFIVEVLNEDNTVNHEISLIVNKLCDINRDRKAMIDKVLNAEVI